MIRRLRQRVGRSCPEEAAPEDGTHPFLAGPGYVGDTAKLRRLGGWIDLDELIKAGPKAANMKLSVKGNRATCK